VFDVNGQEFRKGGLALLLCEVIELEGDLVRIRVMNSEMELAVGVSHDEVLGQLADAELTVFVEAPPAPLAEDPENVTTHFE
jgi:hypothetical protein